MQNPIGQQIKKQLEHTAKGLHEVVGNPQRREISEIAFVTHFIPLFSGQIKDHEEFDRLLSAWFTIAGDPFNEVDVVRQDKSVFTVPAIYDMGNVKPRTKRSDTGLTMDAQLNIIQNNERTNPRMTMNIMTGLVTQTEADLTKNLPKISKNLLRLREIIAQYSPNYRPADTTDSKTAVRNEYVFDTTPHEGY